MKKKKRKNIPIYTYMPLLVKKEGVNLDVVIRSLEVSLRMKNSLYCAQNILYFLNDRILKDRFHTFHLCNKIIDPNSLSSGFTMLFHCVLNICLSNAIRLGHKTCFGQWNASIFDMKKCLK